MPKYSPYFYFCVVLAVLAAMVAVGIQGTGLGDQADDVKALAKKLAKELANVDNDLSTAKYLGTNACRRCHEVPKPSDDVSNVSLTEYAVWKDKDRHSQAYQVLLGERAQRMKTLLGYEDDVTEARQCLTCHSQWLPKQEEYRFLLDFHKEDGVGCESCHGPASFWLLPHFSDPRWRKFPADLKEKHYGMNNVRNPSKRAAICLSCHLGNAEQGKVVNHKMYAAGHPPLPGFEVESFCDRMPRHWRYPLEKLPKEERLPKEGSDAHRTKRMVFGSLVACREAMELTASLAGPKEADPMEADPKEARTNRWPELSLFDCSGCHHDLRSPGWRQSRYGAAGNPGRLRIRSWPMKLVELGASRAGKQGRKLQVEVNRFDDYLGSQPFGRPKKVADAAKKLAGLCTDALKELETVKFDQSMVRALLDQLCSVDGDEVPDYESARQIAMALGIVYGDLSPKPASNQQIETILRELDHQFGLTGIDKRPQGEEALGHMLESAAGYEPSEFHERLAMLKTFLEER